MRVARRDDATPAALVVLVAGLTDPPPLAAAHVTVTPASGLLEASRTITESGVASACAGAPLCVLPPLTATEAAVGLGLGPPSSLAQASPRSSKVTRGRFMGTSYCRGGGRVV